MRFRLQVILVAVFGASLFLSTAARARAQGLPNPLRFFKESFQMAHRERPETGADDAIEQLANQIDWLEHYIDRNGSIVAKHPDIWGESRLMRHRFEYEKQLVGELGKFQVRMNAALRRSDQSFLGMAFALQAASGNQAGTNNAVPIPGATPNSAVAAVGIDLPSTNEPTSENADVVIHRSGPFGLGDNQTGFSFEQEKLSLEPTIQLDQMSRYLNHLHELRRINEGDDISDAPGYSLNLVRIPVSVLPGKETRKGYGAEISVIAEPYLSMELLPATFRNLVVNDLVDTLATPLTLLLNDPDVREALENSRLAQRKAATSKLDAIKAADDIQNEIREQPGRFPQGLLPSFQHEQLDFEAAVAPQSIVIVYRLCRQFNGRGAGEQS